MSPASSDTHPSPPPPDGPGGSMASALRRRYKAIEHHVRIAFPRFAVLQPLPLLLFCVLSWAAAALSAFLLARVRPVDRPFDPTPWVGFWLVVSAIFSVWWITRQWQERGSLPKSKRIPFTWSFAGVATVLVLVFAPGYVSERIAYHVIRDSTSHEGVLYAATILDQNSWGDKDRRSRWLAESAPNDPVLAELWTNHHSFRICHALARTDDGWDRQQVFRYVHPETQVLLREPCEKVTLSTARALRTGEPINRRDLGPIGDLKMSDREALRNALRPHLIAHGELSSTWEGRRLRYYALLIGISLSVATALAGVIPGRALLYCLLVESLMALAVFVVRNVVFYAPERLRGSLDLTLWITDVAPIALPVLLVSWMLAVLFVRRRRPWFDVLMAGIWFSPLLTFFIEAALHDALSPGAGRGDRAHFVMFGKQDVTQLTIIGAVGVVYLILSPFAPALFTRYRQLPSDR